MFGVFVLVLIFLLFGRLRIGPKGARWFSYEGPFYPENI